MEKIKLAIIYYSSTGTNYNLSKLAEEGAIGAGAEVKLLKVPELAPQSAIDSNPNWKSHAELTKDIPIVKLDDLLWADAYIFSVPTRYGVMAAQMKQFIDTTGGFWSKGKLINKVVSAMSSSTNPHGGQEATILSLYTVMFHWGAIVVAPGYSHESLTLAGGNPYGVSVSANPDGRLNENVSEAVRHQARRTVMVAS